MTSAPPSPGFTPTPSYHGGIPPYLVTVPPASHKQPNGRRGLLTNIAVAAAAAVVASAGTAILLTYRGSTQSAATPAAATSSVDVPETIDATTAPATLTVQGTLELHDTNLFLAGSGCAGQGGYSDIASGAAVTITNATGAMVALGRLEDPQLASLGECTFSFSVPDVPAGDGFYGVEVSHRGSVKYAEADLASPLTLTLG